MSDWPDFGGEPRGDWVPITCRERDAIVAAEGLGGFSVAAGFTDTDRGYVYREWARRGEELPAFRDQVWRKESPLPDWTVIPPNDRYSEDKCVHARFVPTERAP